MEQTLSSTLQPNQAVNSELDQLQKNHGRRRREERARELSSVDVVEDVRINQEAGAEKTATDPSNLDPNPPEPSPKLFDAQMHEIARAHILHAAGEEFKVYIATSEQIAVAHFDNDCIEMMRRNELDVFDKNFDTLDKRVTLLAANRLPNDAFLASARALLAKKKRERDQWVHRLDTRERHNNRRIDEMKKCLYNIEDALIVQWEKKKKRS